MKKLIYSMFALAIMAMTFNSCEDVPAPYALPGDDDPVVIEPTGDGTLENPFNVAAALAYVEDLASDVETTQDIYVKGKVSTINTNYDQSDPQFGNAVFYISDDGKPRSSSTFIVRSISAIRNIPRARPCRMATKSSSAASS